jgi:hypothetical protein
MFHTHTHTERDTQRHTEAHTHTNTTHAQTNTHTHTRTHKGLGNCGTARRGEAGKSLQGEGPNLVTNVCVRVCVCERPIVSPH